MADLITPNYGLVKPTPGDAAGIDAWGDKINANLDSIDAVLKVARDSHHGQCRFVYISAAQCRLIPFNGNRIIINGVSEAIPSAGVNLAYTGLANGTAYYVYAWMNGGVMSLEAVATGHSTHTNGVEIKTGDASRTLVGAVNTYSSGFADSNTIRFVASWFNRRRRSLSNTSFANTSSNSYTNLSNVYLNFFCWANTPIESDFAIGVDTPDNGTGGIGITYDTTLQQSVLVYTQAATGNFFMSTSGTFKFDGPAEGAHYFGISGYATTGILACSSIGTPIQNGWVEI